MTTMNGKLISGRSLPVAVILATADGRLKWWLWKRSNFIRFQLDSVACWSLLSLDITGKAEIKLKRELFPHSELMLFHALPVDDLKSSWVEPGVHILYLGNTNLRAGSPSTPQRDWPQVLEDPQRSAPQPCPSPRAKFPPPPFAQNVRDLSNNSIINCCQLCGLRGHKTTAVIPPSSG